MARQEDTEQAQQALDEADVDLEQKRRAVAHPLPGMHFEDAQVAAVVTHYAAFKTVVDGVRDTVTRPEVANALPPEVKRLFDAMHSSFANFQTAMPPEFRQIPQTSLPPDATASDLPTGAAGTPAWDQLDVDLEVVMRG